MKRAALLFALFVFGSARAHAQTQPPPASLGDSLVGQARQDYRSAVLLFDDRDYHGALVKFNHAYELSKDPRLLWNVAVCEKNLRHYGRVLTIVERYQHESAGRLSDERKREIEALLAAVRSLVTVVRVTVDPPGATITVDDEPAGTAPLSEPLRVDLGQHTIRASKPGFKEQTVTRDFAGGAETDLLLTLPPLPRGGRLTVDAGGHGTVSIDGKVVGEGRWEGPLTSGTHAVRVWAPRMRPYTTEIVVAEGETRALYPTLEPERSRVPTLVWVGGGALLAGALGAGAYFLFRPSSERPPHALGTLDPYEVPLP